MISSIEPSFGEQAESYTVLLAGSKFTGATSVSFGAGITVDDFTVDNDTQITLRITIGPAAETGWRTVTVTTPLFTGTRSNGFRVDSAAPLISSIEPSFGEQAESYTVLLAGSKFTGATSVSFGAGITVDDFTVDSDTQITVQVTVGQAAATGWRTVTVTTPLFTGTRSNGFRRGLRAPLISSVEPSFGEQGESYTSLACGVQFHRRCERDLWNRHRRQQLHSE